MSTARPQSTEADRRQLRRFVAQCAQRELFPELAGDPSPPLVRSVEEMEEVHGALRARAASLSRTP